MNGDARQWIAPAPAPPGLRRLADLINDALVSVVTQPAFAMSSPASSRPVGVASGDAATAGGARRPRPGPRPLRPAPVSESATTPDRPDDESPVDDATVDETHAATWTLVQRAQTGDGEAFGLLYDRYVDMVFRFIYFRVNDRALAEDFTSETFLRALRRIGSITYQGRDIGAWFVTIARNIVFDHTKSARHRLETPTADAIETSDRSVHSTEAAVLDTLRSEQLMAAVNRLGDEQRECVVLRFIQGLSVNETAAVMGKNDGAIKALQHRAIRKLADLVGGELR